MVAEGGHPFRAMRTMRKARELSRKTKRIFAMWMILILLHATLGVTDAFAQTANPVRDVTPPGVTRVFRSADARTPVDELHRFARARLDPKGVLWTENQKLDLHGVVLPDPKRICAAPTGARWMCGQRALGALRTVVQDGPIACRKIADLALWMLAEGHAEIAPGITDRSYVEAAGTAKMRRIGLWSNGGP
jgi:endonuclease YncB( thermonuclease family)